MRMLKIAAILVCTFSLANSAKNTAEKDPMTMAKDLMTPKTDKDGMMTDKDSTDEMPDLMEIMNNCNDTFRIEMGYLESLSDSGSFPDEMDKTPKCFVNCVLENTEVVDDDGQFDAEMAAEVFSRQGPGQQMRDIQAMATTCGDNRMESDECVRSYMFMKCLMESKVRSYMKIM